MNYYQILGIPEDATTDQIKQQYKQLIKKYHPDLYKGDKAFANEKTKEITQAYKILVDPTSRNDYDILLHGEELLSNSSNETYDYNNADTSSEEDIDEYYENRDEKFFESKKYKRTVSDVVDETYDNITNKTVDFVLNSNRTIQLLVIILIVLFVFTFFFTKIMDLIQMIEGDSSIYQEARGSGLYNQERPIDQETLDSITLEELQKEFGPDVYDLIENGTFESIDDLKAFYYRNVKSSK